MKTNFFRSNFWIILLIFISLLVANLFAPDIEGEELHYPTAQQKLDSLENIKNEQAFDYDFHYAYLNTYADAKNLATRDFILLDGHLWNYYDSLQRAGEEELVKWAKGYYFLKWNLVDSATYYLNAIPENLKYRNVSFAELHELGGQDSLAAEFYKLEVSNVNGAKKVAVNWLISFYSRGGNQYGSLRDVLNLPGASNHFPFELHREIYFFDKDLLNYYVVVIAHFLKGINTVGLLAATIVALIWLVYLYQLAFFQTVRPSEVVSVLLLGMVFTFLTYLLSDTLYHASENAGVWNMFTWSVIGIGAVEELVKIIPLLALVFLVKRQLEAFEYIFFASISAVGFAFTENLLYFDGEYGLIISGRALTAAVGHMIDSSIFAYGIVLAKFRYKKPVFPYFLMFWGLASLTHGLYDFFIFSRMYFFFYLFFLLCARVWVTIINNSINQSRNFNYASNFRIRDLQFYVTFSLTGVFMFEYLVVSFQEGQTVANMNLLTALFSGGFLIAFLGSKLTSLNLIKDYWGVVNISVNPFTDDIVSQNFVGSMVEIRPYHHDRGLIEYTDKVEGKIVSRVVLQNKERTRFLANDDSQWFMLKLDEPIIESEMRPDYALIKLKDNYSSLNDQTRFMVHFLLIPKDVSFKKRYPFRKELNSLGWAWMNGK